MPSHRGVLALLSRDELLAIVDRFELTPPDMLGWAYQYLIEKFADDAGKKGGEFYALKKIVTPDESAA